MVSSTNDDFGWRDERGNEYGLYQVSTSSSKRQLIPRASAGLYRNLVVANGFKQNADLMGGTPSNDEFLYGQFPDDFAWSTATASYQIEGGWDEGGEFYLNAMFSLIQA